MSSSQKLMRGRLSQFIYRSKAIAALLLLISHLSAQIIIVEDENGQTMVGVQVYSTDFDFTAVSDRKGQISVTEQVKESDILTFSYLGYEDFSASLSYIESISYRVRMTRIDQVIDEVVVYGRRQVSQSEIPYKVETIKASEIASTHSQTSADALAQHGGVYVQKSQMGGGSPLIRGFEANRVLLVVDGVRMNNAIYRSGHLQNAITVDASILEKMDVIFGPNSLMYGSDALGGVVHFSTKSPVLSQSDQTAVSGNYFARYSSANHEKTIHGDVSIAGRKFGSLTSITAVDYADLRSGANRDERFPDFGKRFVYQDRVDEEDVEVINDNPNVQVGTGFRQLDIAQKILFLPNLENRITANIQYSTSGDIPRYDNLSEIRNGELRWGEWDYGPQNRFLASIDYRYLNPTSLWDDVVVIGSYQRIDEDRISRRFGNSIREVQEEDVSVYGLTIDASKYIGPNKSLRVEYGFDIQNNSVISTGKGEDIRIGNRDTPILSRYADGGNDYSTLGGYVTLSGKVSDDRLRYTAGLRFSHINFTLRFLDNPLVNWPTSYIDGVQGANDALTWSAGATWIGNDGWNLRGMISTAFRSPNIDDLAKIRVNSNEITFPNVNLNPEKSLNAELTIGKDITSSLRMSITGFYTDLRDAIVRRNGLGPSGESLWISQGDTLQITTNQNATSAHIYGYSANVGWNSKMGWTIDGSVNFTRGRERQGERTIPFAHIPPVYGQLKIGYERGRWDSQINWRFNGDKPLSEYGGSVDNPDLATPVGTLAWQTFNIYTSYQYNPSLSFSIALENLLDLHYRPFASGVSAPGRNLILSVRGNF